MIRGERRVTHTGPDVPHPGTVVIGRSLDDGDIRIKTPRRRPLRGGQQILDLIGATVSSSPTESGPAEVDEDLVDVYPAGTPIYSGLPTGRGSNSILARSLVGFLPSRQVLVPAAGKDGVIAGESEGGMLVHHIGINGLTVRGLEVGSGWLPYRKRIDPKKSHSPK